MIGDLRYAIRILVKAPVFSVASVLTLALCIGANTAIYTVVDRVLLRPLPYPHPGRLAMIVRTYHGAGVDGEGTSQAGITWEVLRKDASTLDVAATSPLGRGVTLVVGGRAEPVTQHRVSTGYFRVLGVAPLLGREFTDDEDRVDGPAVAVLSHSLWMRAFGGDAGVVGRVMTLRGRPQRIVGVMPASFRSGEPVDVWTPLRPSPTGEGGGENYGIIARVKEGASWAEADAQVAAVTAGIVRERYQSNQLTVRLGIVPLQRGMTEETRRPLFILWGAVGAVLLIGCVNIAGLLLARAGTRASEIATRIALGGGRAAIVRQLLAESVMLAVCGGIAGIALGYASSRFFASLLEDAFGVTGDFGLDGRVLAITGTIALLTGVAFGLLPALQATRVNLREALIEAGTASIAGAARDWPRRIMVATEVALGVVLLVGAGLLIRTFGYFVGLQPGFDASHVVTATVSLQDARYQSSDRIVRLFDTALDGMRAIPGVDNAAVALTLPYERALNMAWRFAGGQPPREIINVTYVTPGYFETLRIPVRRGRALATADSRGAAPVIVVNEAFVRRHSPDQDPIGRQIEVSGAARAIVGIVGDIQQKAAFGNFGLVGTSPAAYVPAAQMPDGFFRMVHTWFAPSWIVRVGRAPSGLVAPMQRAVASVDPQLPFAKFRTLDEVRGQAIATPRAQATLLGTLAGLALLLAAVGLYGLVASSVAERTRELGIRIALGATARQAVAAAAVPGLILAVAGVVIGVAAARAAGTTMQHLVWGVTVNDPATFVAAAGTVLVVATIAALVPALRIVRLSPIRALRTS